MINYILHFECSENQKIINDLLQLVNYFSNSFLKKQMKEFINSIIKQSKKILEAINDHHIVLQPFDFSFHLTSLYNYVLSIIEYDKEAWDNTLTYEFIHNIINDYNEYWSHLDIKE